MALQTRTSQKYSGALRNNLAGAATGIQQCLAVQNQDATVYAFTADELASLNAALTAVNVRLTARQQVTRPPSTFSTTSAPGSSPTPMVGSSSSGRP